MGLTFLFCLAANPEWIVFRVLIGKFFETLLALKALKNRDTKIENISDFLTFQEGIFAEDIPLQT